MTRWVLNIGLALVLTSGMALADAESEARAFFNIGAKAYDAGKYMDAVHAFEQAYKKSARPGLLFSLAQAHRMQFFAASDPARLRDAVKYYRAYLKAEPGGRRAGESTEALEKLVPLLERMEGSEDSSAPAPAPEAKPRLMISSPTPGVRIELDGRSIEGDTFVGEVTAGKHRVRLTAPGFKDYVRDVVVDARTGAPPLDVTLEELPASLSLRAPDGAEVSVDGRFIGVAPLPAISLAAGPHFVSVTANGHRAFTRKLSLARGERRAVQVDLESTGQRTTSWVLMGVGTAGVVTAGVLGVVAVGKEKDAQALLDDAEKNGNQPASATSRYQSLRGERDDLRLAAIIAAGAGVAIGATGLVLHVFDEPRVQLPDLEEGPKRGPTPASKPASMEISALPLFAPGAAGGALMGRF